METDSWAWRNRLTPTTPSSDASNLCTPRKAAYLLLTPPSSGNSCTKTLDLSDTPRSHRTNSGIRALPNEFSKCDVGFRDANKVPMPRIEEEDIPGSRKRKSSELSLTSPKKLCCEISKTKCVHEKGISPIKADFAVPFFLKIPSRKLAAPCPAHDNDFRDILKELEKKNMDNVLHKIFSYLPQLDVTNAAHVSTTWNRIVSNVAPSLRNFKQTSAMVLQSKENKMLSPEDCLKSSRTREAKIQNETTPLKLNIVLKNLNPSPKVRARPALERSPRSKRFDYYVSEGRSLLPGEKFTKCPRCQGPAQFIPETPNALCRQCNHSFCSQCKCSQHSGKTCDFIISLSPSPVKDKRVIGSKASKKALRRLL